MFSCARKNDQCITNMNIDELPLSKTDIIYDNMLSLAAFVSKVMATSITHIPSGSKLKQPQMSKIFDEPIFQAVDFLRTKKCEDNVSNKDMHESSEVYETFREHLLGVKTIKMLLTP